MKKLLILFMAFLAVCQLHAQKTVTGSVKDGSANGDPIIGATVQVSAREAAVLPTSTVTSPFRCLKGRTAS